MGSVKDISARFVEGSETQTLQERGYNRLPTAVGGLWYHPERVALSERVNIRMLGTLWSKTIFVRGARAR